MKIKKKLRSFVFNLTALWVVSQLIEGVVIDGGLKSFLLAALVLTLVNLFIRPLIKLLFLPVNLLTLGAFRWLVNVATLYLVTLTVPQFKIAKFIFEGYQYQGFIIPQMNISSFWAYVVVSFFLSLIVSFIYWLIK